MCFSFSDAAVIIVPPLRARTHLGKNLSWTLKLEWAWMKPVLGRISMCFLISGHTSKVSFKAVLALSGKKCGQISSAPTANSVLFSMQNDFFVSMSIRKMECQPLHTSPLVQRQQNSQPHSRLLTHSFP